MTWETVEKRSSEELLLLRWEWEESTSMMGGEVVRLCLIACGYIPITGTVTVHLTGNYIMPSVYEIFSIS